MVSWKNLIRVWNAWLLRIRIVWTLKEMLLLDGWTKEKEGFLCTRLAHCLPVTNFIVLLSSFWGGFSSFEFLLVIHYKVPNLVM